MMGLLRTPQGFIGRNFWGWRDNFSEYTTAKTWTTVTTNSGTSVPGNFTPGGLLFTTGTTNNNYQYIYGTNANFLYIADKPAVVECVHKYTEVATNSANVGFGFSDSVVAGSLVDDGAGPAASFSGAMIYKVDGGSVWKFCTSIGSTQTISTSTTTAGGAVLQRLKIEIKYVNGVAEVSPWVFSVSQLGTSTSAFTGGQLLDSTTLKPIKHVVTAASIASAAQMTPWFGVKAGTAAAQTAYLHEVAVAQAF